jgi:hypothetical protein
MEDDSGKPKTAARVPWTGCLLMAVGAAVLIWWLTSRIGTGSDVAGREPGVIPSAYAPSAPMPERSAVQAIEQPQQQPPAAAPDTSAPDSPAENPPSAFPHRAERDMFLEISASKLIAVYKANAIKADANYKLRYVQATGTVAEIGKDVATGAAFVAIGSPTELEHLRCFVRPDELREAAALSAGKQAVIRGKVHGYEQGAVLLGDCSID